MQVFQQPFFLFACERLHLAPFLRNLSTGCRVLHWPWISFNKGKHSTVFPFPLLVFRGQPSFCFLLLHPSLLSRFPTLLLISWNLTMMCLDLSVLNLSCLRFIGLLLVWGKFLTFFFPQKTHLTPTPFCPFGLGLYSHIIHITGAFDLSHTLCPLSGLCPRSYFLAPLPVLLFTGKHIRWDLHICYYPLSFN